MMGKCKAIIAAVIFFMALLGSLVNAQAQFHIIPQPLKYQKLGNEKPTTTGIMAFPQPFTPSNDDANNWIKVNGYINIVTEGDYEITSEFLISPQLYLDNIPVISPDKNRYAEPQKAVLHLKAGYYALSGYYPANNVNNREKLIQLKAASGKVLNHEDYLFHQ